MSVVVTDHTLTAAELAWMRSAFTQADAFAVTYPDGRRPAVFEKADADKENERFKEYAGHAEMIARKFSDSANGYGRGRADDRTTGYHAVAAKARELKKAIEDATE